MSRFVNQSAYRTFGVAALPVALSLLAVGVARRQAVVPIRSLVVTAATDSGVVLAIQSVHARMDGSVVLLDPVARRVLYFDATLKNLVVAADTAGRGVTRFGSGLGGLLPFVGDSDVFVDDDARAFIVVGPHGDFGSASSPPLGSDLDYFQTYFTRVAGGQPGFDSRGHLFFRGRPRNPVAQPLPKADTSYARVDSAPILRADFEKRRVDTVAMMRIPAQVTKLIRNGLTVQSFALINPIRQSDDWVHFSDGTVAIVRSQDYHIDWYRPDGSSSSTAKLPFDWRRIDDANKRRIIDSTQHVMDSIRAASAARAAAQRAASNGPPALARPPAGFTLVAPELVRAEDLPDYFPSLGATSQARVDWDDNIWILPNTSFMATGGLLFDVVDRKGALIERVQLPAGRRLEGFGPGRTVILSSVSQSASGSRLEFAKFASPSSRRQ